MKAKEIKKDSNNSRHQNIFPRILLLFMRLKMRVTLELDRRIFYIKRLSRACKSKIWTAMKCCACNENKWRVVRGEKNRGGMTRLVKVSVKDRKNHTRLALKS